MRKNAGVRWARVEEDTRQLTVKCTRITDQRVGWVDRWIQVNRFTRPHVPCISAGCEVKSSGMKFKVLKGRNLLFPKNLLLCLSKFMKLAFTPFFKFISRRYFQLLPFFELFIELSWKKRKKKTSRKVRDWIWEDSENCYPYFNRERKGGGGGGRIKIMDKTTSPFFHKRKKKQNGSRILQRIPPPRF